jgi:hypothetical protein
VSRPVPEGPLGRNEIWGRDSEPLPPPFHSQPSRPGCRWLAKGWSGIPTTAEATSARPIREPASIDGDGSGARAAEGNAGPGRGEPTLATGAPGNDHTSSATAIRLLHRPPPLRLGRPAAVGREHSSDEPILRIRIRRELRAGQTLRVPASAAGGAPRATGTGLA